VVEITSDMGYALEHPTTRSLALTAKYQLLITLHSIMAFLNLQFAEQFIASKVKFPSIFNCKTVIVLKSAWMFGCNID
jgi:uncharacterized membrane protein